MNRFPDSPLSATAQSWLLSICNPSHLADVEVSHTQFLKSLERIHARVRERPIFQRFTLLTRALLVLGFLAPGLTKLFERDFAPGIDAAHPMGAYFIAFHGTGAYYMFVGLVQVIAAVLLIPRRTALLGALLYLPVIGNIFALVTATHFGVGTPVMTGMMTLACLWLLVWDAHRLTILFSSATRVEQRATEPALWDALAPLSNIGWPRLIARCGFVIAFTSGVCLTLWARGLTPFRTVTGMLIAVAIGGILTLIAWVASINSRQSV